ncbi:hypothetical protein ACLS0M_07770 [Avibacterium avium]|uniref:Uncharacterized protein n=3 Tax=Avibacterium avium TaxID=751 RepID=A0A379ARE2_AVIAV|nr:hypothetical protein [Avibacterium avium]SUB23982.1 Uncharacterised protein [Avibacterium avium]
MIVDFNDITSLTREQFIDKYSYRTFSCWEISTSFLQRLIEYRMNFSINTSNVIEDARIVEAFIERNGFTCRVYTENRAAGMGAALFSGVGTVIGAATAIGIAAHNLATYNPDFEVGKNLLDKKINVTYKK